MDTQRIVTLTTDFGLTDHYVGAMKGVIYNYCPSVQVVDITNSVQSFDVLDGAIAISQAYSYFPGETIHVVVVDPGVGGARRPILARAGAHFFLAPDNGVLSLVYEREERVSVWHLTAGHYFLQPVSNTFHGRDIFAAVAGALAKGVEVSKLGDEITDYVRFLAPKPKASGPNAWKGVVLKIDKFGNIITNISPNDIPQLFQPGAAFKITVGKAEATQLRSSYVEGGQGEIFAIIGSTGFLEICANKSPASRLAGVDKGNEVVVTVG